MIQQNKNLTIALCIFIHLGQVVTGSWDKTIKCWDPRGVSGPERTLVGTYAQPERVYSMSLVGNRLVVATAGRHVNIYDLRNMSQPEQKRDSSLKYQTRCVRCFPNGTGNLFSLFTRCTTSLHVSCCHLFSAITRNIA
jgi:WD40 repeat protein